MKPCRILGMIRVVKDYRAKYPDVSSIGIPVGCSYAAMQILAKAIEMAGTLGSGKASKHHCKGRDDDRKRSHQIQGERIGFHQIRLPSVARWEKCPDIPKRSGHR